MPERAIASNSVERVRAALASGGFDVEIVTFDASTRTAADAAAAIGTSVQRIVKSLVFVAGDQPVVVLASGANRVDTGKLAIRLGAGVRQATPDEVRAATGYAIGGVAPLGYPAPLPVLVDRDLLALDEIWAAAGTSNAVFRIPGRDLLSLTGGQVADVKVD